jgi:hypothetical protein
MVLSLRETRPPGRYTNLVPGAAGNSLATRWRPTGTPAQRPQPSNVCHASRSYSWISSPRTSWRRIRTVARSATEAVAMPPRLAALPSRRERDRDPQLLPIGASVYCCFPRCFPAPRWIALPSGGQRRGCAGTSACPGESRPAPARSRRALARGTLPDHPHHQPVRRHRPAVTAATCSSDWDTPVGDSTATTSSNARHSSPAGPCPVTASSDSSTASATPRGYGSASSAVRY